MFELLGYIFTKSFDTLSTLTIEDYSFIGVIVSLVVFDIILRHFT